MDNKEHFDKYGMVIDGSVLISYNEGYDETLIIPDFITSIKENAWVFLDNTTSLKFGKNIKDIPLSLFARVTLEEITVDKDNPYYCDKDGVLYDKRTNQIVHVPRFKSGNVTIMDGVEKINKGDFDRCENIESVKLSSSVKVISSSSFDCCFNLSTIEGNDTLEEIEKDAFLDCYSLSSFTGFENNENFNFENGILYSKEYKDIIYASPCIKGDVVINEKLEKIDKSTFSKSKGIESITLTNSDIHLDKDAFYIDSKEKDLILSSTFTSFNDTSFLERVGSISFIGDNPSFSFIDGEVYNKDKTILYFVPKNTSGVYSVREGVEEISSSCFVNIKEINEIYIPLTVKKIGVRNFIKCPSLKQIVVDEKNDYFKSLDGYLYNKDESKLLRALNVKEEVVHIKEGVCEISSYAFFENPFIKELILPSSMKGLGDFSFYSCPLLSYVELNESLKEIRNSAFTSCSNLTYIDIPKNVTIDEKAFDQRVCALNGQCDFTYDENVFLIYKNCLSLYIGENEDIILPEGLKEIGIDAFYDKEIKSIYIPSTVEKINEKAFNFRTNIQRIEVSENNENYFIIDGVLYEKNTNTLFMVLPQCKTKKLVIKEGTQRLNPYTDYSCVEEIEFPSSFLEIDTNCFNKKALKSVKVSKDNPLYSSHNCVLYDKDFNNILYIPFSLDSKLIIADGIKTLPYSYNFGASYKSLYIPSSVTYIQKEFLLDSSHLEYIDVSPNNEKYASYKGILYDKSFSNIIYIPHLLKEDLWIADGIKELSIERQMYLSSMMPGILQDPLKKVKVVHIPKSVNYIFFDFLALIPKAEYITVDPLNPYFTSLDGIVYDKEVKKALLFPPLLKGDVVIPSTVTSLYYNAIEEDTSITSIEFLNKEMQIDNGWFDTEELLCSLVKKAYPVQLDKNIIDMMLLDIVPLLIKGEGKENEYEKAWKSYIKENYKKHYEQIKESLLFLNYLMTQKMLDLEALRELIDWYKDKDNIDTLSLLLDYQNNNFSEEEILNFTLKTIG